MSTAPGLFSDGKAYERLMGRWSQRVAIPFIDWLGLPKGLRWLDVGCGNGAFTETLIARAVPQEVEAIDPSEGQIAYARTRPGAKMARFQTGSAQELPFPQHRFDASIMALVITFVPDAQKAVQELARVTRRGGMVATYMWDTFGGGLPMEPIHAAIRSLGVSNPHSPGFEASREDRLRAIWHGAGLQSVETRVIRIKVEYADFDDFWTSNAVPVGPAGQAILRLQPGQRDELKARLLERLPVAADGTISYEAHANAIKGLVTS